jgi:hypothetical protein
LVVTEREAHAPGRGAVLVRQTDGVAVAAGKQIDVEEEVVDVGAMADEIAGIEGEEEEAAGTDAEDATRVLKVELDDGLTTAAGELDEVACELELETGSSLNAETEVEETAATELAIDVDKKLDGAKIELGAGIEDEAGIELSEDVESELQ